MGWSQMLEPFEKMFPKTKFIYPTAKVSPVTLNFGMSMTSWHDIKSLDTLNHADFTGIDDSKQTITDLIDDEVKNGVASDRIILGGFSQGAALSAYTGKTVGSKNLYSVMPCRRTRLWWRMMSRSYF